MSVNNLAQLAEGLTALGWVRLWKTTWPVVCGTTAIRRAGWRRPRARIHSVPEIHAIRSSRQGESQKRRVVKQSITLEVTNCGIYGPIDPEQLGGSWSPVQL